MNKYILTFALLAISFSSCVQNREKDTALYTEDSIANIDIKISSIDDLINSEKIEDNNSNKSEKGTVFVGVEQMPFFQGGEGAMMKFISDNLIYPSSAQKEGIQGRVTVRFAIETDGSLSDIQILRGIDKECDKEVIRIVESMPKWVPGKLNGKEVRMYYNLPITFRLNE